MKRYSIYLGSYDFLKKKNSFLKKHCLMNLIDSRMYLSLYSLYFTFMQAGKLFP